MAGRIIDECHLVSEATKLQSLGYFFFKNKLRFYYQFSNFFVRWRICFWVSTIPACLLAIFMEFAVESPHWLYKVCCT